MSDPTSHVRAGEPSLADEQYRTRLEDEIAFHSEYVDIGTLPAIHVYWANTYIRPMLLDVAAESPDDFAAQGLLLAAERCGASNACFASLGSGNCDTEVRLARALLERGLDRFEIHCVDVNRHMLERGRELAAQEGVGDYVIPVHGDLNDWTPDRSFHGVLANQSLHHVLRLERLFEVIDQALPLCGLLVVNDMIGRNGHLRWPEALEPLLKFWNELPPSYRYNRQLDRFEEQYENWDCSQHGFEGIRSQDILSLLLSHFSFEIFIAFGNVIDVFVDRCFGHNFDTRNDWDREFIDRVHAFDEEGFSQGTLTPTHMIGLLGKSPVSHPHFARGLNPQSAVRNPRERRNLLPQRHGG